MARLDRIVADASRARIAVPAAKGTPPKYNLLERWLIYETLGGIAEHASGHLTHGLGYVVPPAYVAVTHLRKMGLEKVGDLVTEMMLHPELAHTALAKVSDAEVPSVLERLSRQYPALVLAPGNGSRQQPQAAPVPALPRLPMRAPVYWGPNGGYFGVPESSLLSGAR